MPEGTNYNQPDPFAQCEYNAYFGTVGNVGLDLIGVILGEAAANTVVRLGALSIQGANFAINASGSGGALLGSSYGTAFAGAYFSSGTKASLGTVGKAIGQSIPILNLGFTAVSVLNDFYQGYKATNAFYKAK